jgi:hypothetical protein
MPNAFNARCELPCSRRNLGSHRPGCCRITGSAGGIGNDESLSVGVSSPGSVEESARRSKPEVRSCASREKRGGGGAGNDGA